MYQKTIIVGNLGKDPEMRYTPAGEAVTNMSVACNRKYTDKGGQLVKETTWYRVTVWGKQAESCNSYLKKGSLVLVDGRLTPDKDTGGPRVFERGDGSPGASFELTAADVKFLVIDKSGAVAEHTPSSDGAAGDEDHIPF